MPVFIDSCFDTTYAVVEPVVFVDAVTGDVSAVLFDFAVDDSLDDEFGVVASGVGDLELLLLNTLNTLSPPPSLKLPFLLLLLLRDKSSSSDTSSE
jgi:hypothetical protein